jgi:hypothetical protein
MNNIGINEMTSGVALLRVSKLTRAGRKLLKDKGFSKCDPLNINNRHGNNYHRWCAKKPDMKDMVSFLKNQGSFGMSWWVTSKQDNHNLPATDKQWQARIIF